VNAPQPRRDVDIPDFTIEGVEVVLNWRHSQPSHHFWTVKIGRMELDLDQAEAVKHALVELEARRAGLSYDGMKEPNGHAPLPRVPLDDKAKKKGGADGD
jgi:hypothetical protein